MSELQFRGVLEPFGPAGALVLSDEQVEQLGGGRRGAVVVRIGTREARVRLAVMGGQTVIGLSKANRALLAVAPGDPIDAIITLDEAPRTVTVPADLAQRLAAEPDLAASFEKLAFTHKREFVEWVKEAKRPATRERRLAGTLEMLRAGRTRS